MGMRVMPWLLRRGSNQGGQEEGVLRMFKVSQRPADPTHAPLRAARLVLHT
jgi:hypothetical protein